MRSSDRLPVQGSTELPRSKASYYRHQFHRSLTSKVGKVVCAAFLSVLLVVGVVLFILWISLRPHRPRFHIVYFSVTGLDQPTGFQNAQIVFNVTVRNPNQQIWFHYGAFEGAVYYKYDRNRIGSKKLLDPLDQEPKNTTIIHGMLGGDSLTVDGTRWSEIMSGRNLGNLRFSLELASTIRFKVSTWYRKRHAHRMYADCEIAVGSDGVILASDRNKRCTLYFT